MDQPRRRVDIRYVATTTLVVVAVAMLSLGAVFAIGRLFRVVTFLLVALFFAVVLTPPVDLLVRKAKMRRGLATLVVFFLGLVLLASMIYTFVRPLIDQGSKFSTDLPTLVKDAEKGRGPVGRMVKRYKLQDYVRKHRREINKQVDSASGKGLTVLRGVFTGIVAGVTVMVLTVLLLLSGPDLSNTIVNALPERHQRRVRRVAADAARAVAGYMFGNVVISIIAGVFVYIFLRIFGVPYPEVLALWVAFADLIPLVGATLGAIPSVAIAFLQSVPVGIAAIVFFVLYQQFENNVLQMTVMSRTVNVNPLGIFVSVLIGVELLGLLGGLLAIPAAGVIQVVVRDLWDGRNGQLKEEPTIGEDELPVDEVDPAPTPA